MNSRIIENEAFLTWFDQRGFFHTMVKPSAVITLQQAMQNTEAVRELCDGQRHPILVDLRKIKKIEQDAMDHFSLQGKRRLINGMALVISSPISRIIGNFFISLKKPAVITRLFSSEEQAILWLEKQIAAAEIEAVILD